MGFGKDVSPNPKKSPNFRASSGISKKRYCSSTRQDFIDSIPTPRPSKTNLRAWNIFFGVYLHFSSNRHTRIEESTIEKKSVNGTMPAKRIKAQPDGHLSLSRDGPSSSFVQNTVSGLTAPENRSLVTAVGLFAVCYINTSALIWFSRLQSLGRQKNYILIKKKLKNITDNLLL